MGLFKKHKTSSSKLQTIDFRNSEPSPPLLTNTELEQEKTGHMTYVNFSEKTDLINPQTPTETLDHTGFAPDCYDDVLQIADLYIKNKDITIHLDKLEKAERIRLLDFMSGVMYAYDGKVEKLMGKSYHFTMNLLQHKK